MPTQISDYPEHFHRILKRYTSHMSMLEGEYKKSKPDAEENEFKQHVFEPAKKFCIQHANLPSLLDFPSAIYEIVNALFQDQQRVESDVAFIHLSCVYATAAMATLEAESQDRDMAWEFLCQANFYAGTVVVTNRSDEAVFTDSILAIYKTSVAATAGSKRHAKTNQLKERARAIVRAQAPWPSQASAILAVESELLKEFGADCLKDAENTIRGWIKAMPDRLELIPSLAGRLKQAT